MQAMTEAVDHLRTEVRLATETAPFQNGYIYAASRARRCRLPPANHGSPSPSPPSFIATGE